MQGAGKSAGVVFKIKNIEKQKNQNAKCIIPNTFGLSYNLSILRLKLLNLNTFFDFVDAKVKKQGNKSNYYNNWA